MTEQDNNAAAADTPLLEILKRFETRMARHASKSDLTFGTLQIEVNGFRVHLARLLGKEHPALAHFPKLATGTLAREQLQRLAVERLEQVRTIIYNLENLLERRDRGDRVFIGHGRSPVWRELKDFIQDRLCLPWDEFNADPVAGMATAERLNEMLNRTGFAFLIMTGEDTLANGQEQARPNVIHEVGLFQGRLGMRRAIILLEEGCAEFSNIIGLTQIRFPKGRISACFEDVRQVLEREQMMPPPPPSSDSGSAKSKRTWI